MTCACLEGSVLGGELLGRRRELQQRGIELRLEAARLREPRRELGHLPLARLEGLLVVELGGGLASQGLDLQVILSARSRLAQIRRFSIEVVSDDCDVLYHVQPKCSAVVSKLATHGFQPVTPVHCTPRVPKQTRSQTRRKPRAA